MNKKLLAVAISSALAAPMAAQAIDVKVSGHVNRAIMFADDGVASDVAHVDSATSQSRIRWTGSGDLGVGGMKVGARLEWGFSSNLSNRHTIKSGDGGDVAFNIRYSELWFSGSWGKLSAGHGEGSNYLRTFTDLSGTGLATNVGQTSLGGGIAYRTPAGGAVGTTVGATHVTYTGGRYDRLRYDSPTFGPVAFAVDVGENEHWGIAGTLSTSFSGAKLSADIGYEQLPGGGTDQWGGSASILFSQGTNLTVAYSERDNATDPDNFYIKLGHKWGQNAISIDYSQTDDAVLAGDDATSWGIGFAHSIPGPNVQLYAGYQNFDLDRAGTAVEDVDLFAIGSRVRF